MRKAISSVLVIAMMVSTFGASNVQAASINSGSNYVKENGVVVEASATDADDESEIETNRRDSNSSNLDSVSMKDNIEGVSNVDPNNYKLLKEEIISQTETLIDQKVVPESEDRTSADRIHYLKLNDSGSATGSDSSDAIIIESNGHYGLIDTSNRWTVSGYSGGSNYNAKSASASGAQVLKYLSSIGVDHLDFVLVTHAHSDHLGGVPNIVQTVAGMSLTDVEDSTYKVEEEYYDDQGDDIKDEDIIDLISTPFAISCPAGRCVVAIQSSLRRSYNTPTAHASSPVL